VRELPETLFTLLDMVLIDTDHALAESGDLIVPLHSGWIEERQIMTLGRFLDAGDRQQSATTLFKSVGMALFDVCAAKLVYDKAVEQGLGQEIRA
jgi:ornithine cyclodeaminase